MTASAAVAAPVDPASAAVAMRAPALSAIGMTKTFGSLVALDDVSFEVAPGSVHALLGENGAGKSTLVKCIMGYYRQDRGQVLLDGTERAIRSPRDAQAAGIGMVYQHFTLVPSLTAAENLVVARADAPAFIDWAAEKAKLDAFMERMPFRVPLDIPVADLSAGEKQKLEILKLLALDQRFLILDEPTSVLTPDEADEVLGLLGAMARRGEITVLMITHKFREVNAYADAVTVLRRGRRAGGGPSASLSVEEMSRLMIGETPIRERAERVPVGAKTMLELVALFAENPDGSQAIAEINLKIKAGEIVGIAGVSGNGQSALVEALSGQRTLSDGRIFVRDQPFEPSRANYHRYKVFGLPEEPLRNAAAPQMSVAENIAFRSFDRPPLARFGWWLSPGPMRAKAQELIERYRVKTSSPDAPIATLSGGNVQRAILARELSSEVDVLIVANPCFGLDFASVADIRAQILDARNRGAAVLLVSEDLDEILELSDRVAVMSGGRIVHVADIAKADRNTIGKHMAGQHMAGQHMAGQHMAGQQVGGHTA
jgi:general nucleoside transport system ATP-binding protein